ncbi:hypothetical protein KPL70_003484 [Citrus sinensis]|nr:hypothetical protein KPL70_003484 [Citrus sinensis]
MAVRWLAVEVWQWSGDFSEKSDGGPAIFRRGLTVVRRWYGGGPVRSDGVITMATSTHSTRSRKATPQRTPIPPQETSEFERLHLPITPLCKRFDDRFLGQKVLDSYYVDIKDFKDLIVCDRSVRNMLRPWESAIDFDDRVYPNLVRVFYSNMEISETRLDRIVTQVGGVLIEFDVEFLNNLLRISDDGHKIYTSQKALSFDSFEHCEGVRNICRRRDLPEDICTLPFRSQLLPLQVRILHTILQHIITPRKGHSDKVTRLDVGLLDSLITGRPINLGYIIVRHMLSTLVVNHRLLPYGSIISKILRHFEVPLRDVGYMETKRIGPEAMTSIRFSRRNSKWIKNSTSKNRDTLIAPEDDRMLNDVRCLSSRSAFGF